jgi:peptide/nickel transport system permease protein
VNLFVGQLKPSAKWGAPTGSSLVIGACFGYVVLTVALGIFGPALVPNATQNNLLIGVSPPGPGHLLGTDSLGRDVLALTLAGARPALIGPLIIVAGALLIGNALGLIAGYLGGLWDSTIMRLVDLMYALPSVLVAIVLIGLVGGGYTISVAFLTAFFWPQDARIVRAATLEQRTRPYVEAVRVLGVPLWRIMVRHIWPNLLPLVVANSFLNFAFALVSLSALSFLGLGVPPGDADWGRMLSDNRTLIFVNPAASITPALMIVLLALSMNLIGDWLLERLSARGRAQ